jgi:RND family efflux transporter MFP subunit
MTMKKIIIIVIVMAVLALVTFRLITNYHKVNASKNISTDLAYVAVNVTPAKRMALPDSLRLTGYMEAYIEVQLASQAQGTVTLLNAELGKFVSKGEVIATVDDKLKQLAVQRAQNSVTTLAKDMERNKNLYAGGSLTQQQLDNAQQAYDNSVIQLQEAEKQLENATVKSPVSGIITARQTDLGEYVNIGSSVATVVDISRLKIKLNVSEGNVYKVHPGDAAVVTTGVYPGVTFEGSITFVSPQGDAAHNYPVEITIPNNPSYQLKAGTFASVLIRLPRSAEALYIPRESLLGSINDAEVYISMRGKAIRKRIVAQDGDGTYIRILSGLSEGDSVIVNGQINLSDNKEIKVIN